jgi:hypothetical protein
MRAMGPNARSPLKKSRTDTLPDQKGDLMSQGVAAKPKHLHENTVTLRPVRSNPKCEGCGISQKHTKNKKLHSRRWKVCQRCGFISGVHIV